MPERILDRKIKKNEQFEETDCCRIKRKPIEPNRKKMCLWNVVKKNDCKKYYMKNMDKQNVSKIIIYFTLLFKGIHILNVQTQFV